MSGAPSLALNSRFLNPVRHDRQLAVGREPYAWNGELYMDNMANEACPRHADRRPLYAVVVSVQRRRQRRRSLLVRLGVT